VPAVFELQDIVAVPDPVRLLGVIAPQVSPDGTASVRLTVPVKPFWPVMVTVELVDWPALTVLGEVAEIVKSVAGGPGGMKVSRHPHPMGLLLHCSAPYGPVPGVFVQLPAGHQTQLILWGLLLS